jgi:hypothetical protein
MRITTQVLFIFALGVVSAWLYAGLLQHKELTHTLLDWPMIVAFGVGAIFGGGLHEISGTALIGALTLQFSALWAVVLYAVSRIRRGKANRKTIGLDGK